MLQYVDGFSCHLNESKDTLVLHFTQKEPMIVENGEEESVEVVTNKIASIVMDSNCAQGLISVIAQLFDTPNENDNE